MIKSVEFLHAVNVPQTRNTYRNEQMRAVASEELSVEIRGNFVWLACEGRDPVGVPLSGIRSIAVDAVPEAPAAAKKHAA